MIRRTTPVIMAVALAWSLAAGLLAPASALADGPENPIATSYAARINHAPAGIDARVVDGYLEMWLSVPANRTVEVLDIKGAPYLRFARGGVYVNHNSVLFYYSRTPTEALPPANLTAKTEPDWVRVSSGHSWLWRDGRLQAFAQQAMAPNSDYAGPWSIPLRVDGTNTNVSGGLWYQPAPSVVWFWPVAVIVLCVLAAWRLGSARLDRRVATALSAVLFAALAVAALGRLLQGNPHVGAVGVIELVIALAALAGGAATLARGRYTTALPFILAFVGLWAGLTFLPLLTHAYTQVVLPAWLERAATSALLGASLSLVLVALRRPLAR